MTETKKGLAQVQATRTQIVAAQVTLRTRKVVDQAHEAQNKYIERKRKMSGARDAY